MPDIKAIIFDMDGVLIEAKEWHYEALNQALALFGYTITREEHLTEYDGLPTAVKLKMLSEKKGLPYGLHSFINEMKQQYTMDIVMTQCHPMFIHEYALSRLKKEGYHIAVASNSIAETIDWMMKKSGLKQYLDFFLSNQDVSRPKPDPEIYQKAMARLGLEPSECLVVEDNHNGILAARRARAHVMEVETVYDVNYPNICRSLHAAEAGQC